MARAVRFFALSALAAAGSFLTACAQPSPKASAVAQPLYVPTTLILQNPAPVPAATAAAAESPLAFQVLAAADPDEAFFPRWQKTIYGSVILSEYSAYSVLLYDVQPISSPRGTGYRYTWSVREGAYSP